MPSLQEMLQQAMGEDSPSPKATLTTEQQITRLKEAFSIFHAAPAEAFEPGQVLWHRDPAGANIRDAELPHLFVKYIEPIRARDHINDPTDLGGSVTTLEMDCMIMVVVGGDKVATFLSDSRYWAKEPSAWHRRKMADELPGEVQ